MKKKKRTRSEIRKEKITIDFSNYEESKEEEAADIAFASGLSLDGTAFVTEQDFLKLLNNLK